MRQGKIDEMSNKKQDREAEAVEQEDRHEDQTAAKRKAKDDDPSEDGKDTKAARKHADQDSSSKGSQASSRAGDPKIAVSAENLTAKQKQADKKLEGDDEEKNVQAKGHSASAGKVPWHVAEKGLVYFFYRPKVKAADKAESTSVSSLDDVQNTFMILVPRASESETAPASNEKLKSGSESQDKKKPPNPTGYRLISLGKKRLPDPAAALEAGQEPGGIGGPNSEAIWATIAEIGTDIKQVADGMDEQRYSTKTRGERVKPAARPAGRGHYVLSIKTTEPPSSREVHLTYHISHPASKDFGDVQKELGLHPSSSVLLQMRNPTLSPTGPNAPRAGLPADSRAQLTKQEMQDYFGGEVKDKGNRYGRPEQPGLLDRQGVELLVIKRANQEDEGLKGLGDHQADALQRLAEVDSERLSDEAVLKELKMSSESVEVAALDGDWI